MVRQVPVYDKGDLVYLQDYSPWRNDNSSRGLNSKKYCLFCGFRSYVKDRQDCEKRNQQHCQ